MEGYKGKSNVGLGAILGEKEEGKLNVGNLKDLLNKQNEEKKEKVVRGKYNTSPRSERKAIKFKIDRDVYKEFLDLRFNIYNAHNDKGSISNAKFIKLILKNVENQFLKKYKKINQINENDVLFLKSAGRKVNIHEYYPFEASNTISTSITLEVEIIDLFYRLAITYFNKERVFLQQYSLMLFLYDIISMIEKKELKLKYYNNQEIEDWVKKLK